MLSMGLFFFKQKTAYEMRISDWSSDVCSSDLTAIQMCTPASTAFSRTSNTKIVICRPRSAQSRNSQLSGERLSLAVRRRVKLPQAIWRADQACHAAYRCVNPLLRLGSVSAATTSRSEEHTSELQSLMRISYAVFCLKKTTK